MPRIPDRINDTIIGDAGNIRPLASLLSANSHIVGSTGYPGDSDDYFTFVAQSSGTASFSLTGLSADLDLRLLDASGNLITVSANAGNNAEVITAALTAGATYYLQVDPWLRSASEYTLKVDLPESTPPSPSEPAEWSILVYLAADNNLEPYAIMDLNEMEAPLLPDSIAISAILDRIPGYDTSNGNWTGTRQGQVIHDTSYRTVSSFANFENLGELNTGDPETLTNFIDWAVTAHPAENYALIIWNHGGGLSGAAWDDTDNNDNLSMAEITSAIAASTVEQFDIIAFDACQMAMLEQAWALMDLTDVFLASQENVPGTGSPYDLWLEILAADTRMNAQELGMAIVETYGQEYEEDRDEVTFSAVNTAALSSLNTALESFISAALSGSVADWSILRTAAEETFSFPYNHEDSVYGDLGQFMSLTAAATANATLASTAHAVETALDAAVFAQSGRTDASGLSIYLPHGDQSVSAEYVVDDIAFLGASNWDAFLNTLV